MLRRFLGGLLALSMVFLSCPVSLAASAITIPYGKPEGSDTALELFLISQAPSEGGAEKFIVDWFSSPNSLLFCSAAGDYFFVDIPVGGKLSLVDAGNKQISIGCDKTYRYVKFSPGASGTFNFVEFMHIAPGVFRTFDKLVCGDYLATNTLPTLSFDYMGKFQGNLIIRMDNSDIPTDPEEPSGGGILDWLLSFWDKLKDLILGLFVPEEGYFDSWFKTIKDAFDAKTGGLGSLFTHLGGFWDTLKNSSAKPSSLILETKDNQYFPGYQGIKVDLLASGSGVLSWLRPILGGILIVYTIIYCYRKLAAIIKGE